uniref:Serine/threonine protein kinase n=1 Tax=Streptomyces sp. NBC_00008 TaxID=2903610 RepID=A0AAU2VRF4_9ACTN
MTSTSHSHLADSGSPRRTTLSFNTPEGGRRTTPARLAPRVSRRDPQLPQLIRSGILDDEGQACVQVWLTAADAANPAARALLDRETGTALRLYRAFRRTPSAPLFPTLIGHELDTPEPYLLYEPPRGSPAARTHVMSATDLRPLAHGLMQAVSLLDGQDLVPLGISPGTVLWDGGSLQLWGLEAVVRTGRPRTRWGRAPYCSPEQRREEGLTDPRDGVWSAAQVLYQLVTGRPGPADRAPADLASHRVLAETLRGAFAPLARDRPAPAALLDLLDPGASRRLALDVPADESRPHRQAFEQTLRLKQQAPAAEPHEDPDGTAAGEVVCPYCLENIQLDLGSLFVTDSRMQYQPLNPSGIANPLRRQDIMRGAVQKCTADPDFPEHFIPVPYLTYGKPLTIAMVGQSSTGKSHLLTQMIAAITDGGLEPFGLQWQSVNPEQHARFVRERVQPLRNGQVLDHTSGVGLDGFARFVESLLITDAQGQVRPVAFFDLGGEDLVRTDSALRFLLGVDAMVFVVDPALALPLPQLDHARQHLGLEVNRDGDLAFATVLDRLPKNGPYLDVAAAMVLGKADLLRFQPPVDRWLGEPAPTALDPGLSREESGDVYALLRRFAGQAWLRPFDTIRRCTLHVSSATGGQEAEGRYPAGSGPRRVLEPLLSLLAMHGLIEVPGGAEAFAVGKAPAMEAVPLSEASESSREETM